VEKDGEEVEGEVVPHPHPLSKGEGGLCSNLIINFLLFLVGFLVGLIESNKKYLTCNLHNKKLKDNTKINKPAGAGAPLTNDQASFSFGEGLGLPAETAGMRERCLCSSS
jgi:hypothetical protein